VTRARAAAFAVSLLLAALGCKGAVNDNPFPPPGGGGGNGLPGHVQSGTVAITIDGPTSGTSFSAGTLIPIAAHVSITDGTDFVDTSSVRVYVTRAGGSTMVETGQLVPASGDLYTGRVSLGTDLPSDTYTLWVTAASSGGATGKASVDFVIDSGPVITITSPVEGGSYRTSVVIEFRVSDPFGLKDVPTANVGPVSVSVMPADPNEQPPTVFRGDLTFDYDPNQQPLTGPQLLSVAAVNNNGNRTEVQLIFVVDNEGPLITMTRPQPQDVVGGIIDVSATVQDNAGVLDSSVIAIIGDDTGTPLFNLPLKPRGAGSYGVLFDSNRLTECAPPPATSFCIVYPTISFRASDEVGNETVVGYPFSVDNVAPVADLDPPNVRDIKLDGVYRCSHSFDPLGVDQYDGDMPNDGKAVPQVFDLRARIQDHGNRAAGLKVVPLAGIDPTQTNVYILDDTSQPLVVDTDGNGTCDDINPMLVPTTEPPTDNNQVLKIRLAPVPPSGAADFTPDGSLPTLPASLPAGTPCWAGIDPQPPEPLCIFEQPTIAIGYAEMSPAIWSVEPIGGLRCLGNQFDALANNIHEGWACIAVGTKDSAGNRSVSAPLRVWIDYDFVITDSNKTVTHYYSFNQTPPASANAGPMPACTGTFANGTVTPGACTTRRYPPNEFCYKGNDCVCYPTTPAGTECDY
jgi:hypothetical protein